KFPVNPAATPAAVDTPGSMQLRDALTPGADVKPKMLFQDDIPWKSSITRIPPPETNEAMAEALLAIPREPSVEGSLQHLPGEARNKALKPDKEAGTEEKPVTG